MLFLFSSSETFPSKQVRHVYEVIPSIVIRNAFIFIYWNIMMIIRLI